jgi:hypothetical protein
VLRSETARAIREAKERFDEGEIDEAAFKETKAGLLMVGRQVRMKIPNWGWHEGVVESVEDGLCKIAWSDGDPPAYMTVSDVAKILKPPLEVPTRVLVPGDAREPEVLFSCRYDRATERYY